MEMHTNQGKKLREKITKNHLQLKESGKHTNRDGDATNKLKLNKPRSRLLDLTFSKHKRANQS